MTGWKYARGVCNTIVTLEPNFILAIRVGLLYKKASTVFNTNKNRIPWLFISKCPKRPSRS